MISKLIAYLGILLLTGLPTKIGTTNTKFDLAIRLPEVVVTAKRYKSHKSSFLGFSLLGRCNTNISGLLKKALESFPGPKVGITSLRRDWNNHSQHNCGKAVDMAWDRELIDFLVTDEGSAWLEDHSLMFYIEDKPGSKKLQEYKVNPKYSNYVFENPCATGPHIHIQIRK